MILLLLESRKTLRKSIYEVIYTVSFLFSLCSLAFTLFHTHNTLLSVYLYFFSIFKPFILILKARCSNLFYFLLEAVVLDFGGYALKSPGVHQKEKLCLGHSPDQFS